MTSFHSGTPIRARSIAEIARGKLHHYGIEHIPRNPYAYGSLRHLFRTSSIRRQDSPELRHLKSEGERHRKELIENLPTREEAYALTDKLKETERKDQKPIEVNGRKFEFDAWNTNIVEKDGDTVIPYFQLETKEQRKARKDSERDAKTEKEVKEELERKAKRPEDIEEDLESGGAEL